MITTIYKYPLSPTGSQIINMPEGAELLSVQAQHSEPMLWARVDPDAPLMPMQIFIFGTGHLLPDGIELNFVDTYQLMGGDLVFHVFA